MGGALAIYAAEEAQRTWPGHVRAVVALVWAHGLGVMLRDLNMEGCIESRIRSS